MGYAIARMAMLRGAQVTLVSGPTDLEPVPFVEMVPVKSAEEMFEAVTSRSDSMDMFFMAAAVADYTPMLYADKKIKKTEATFALAMKRTKDILGWLGEHRKKGQVLCGFSMETENLLENSREKLKKKNADVICANNLKTAGAGFGTDTNAVTVITAEHEVELPLMSKERVAEQILTQVLRLS